ncbi:MAG: YcxB family protein [Clostridia bacterium]|nr:YcxB family protein [Clostridia bacterium]
MERLEIRGELHPDEMLEMLRKANLKRFFSKRSIFNYIVFALLYTFAFQVNGEMTRRFNAFIYSVFCVVFFFVMLAINMIFTQAHVKRSFEIHKERLNDERLVITDQGVTNFVEDAGKEYKWEEIVNITESKNVFLLSTNEGTGIYIAKAWFGSEEEVKQFKEWSKGKNTPQIYKSTDEYEVVEE